MFFDDSRPDRIKRAKKSRGVVVEELTATPIPKAKAYLVLTPDEIFFGGDRTLICDVECYRNYFLVAFKCIETGKVVWFELSPNSALNVEALTYILHRFRIITFNGKRYDIPLIQLALKGLPTWKLKEISDEIIFQELQAYEVARNYQVRELAINHVDLIEVAPIEASLKIYAGRLHCERMQDLPYSPSQELSYEEACNVRDYCINDLDNTELLFDHLKGLVALREVIGKEIGEDLRSKSDAQVAEAVVKFELDKIGALGKKPTIEPGWTFKYKVPDFVKFKTPQFQAALETVRNATFVVGNGGSAELPAEIAALDLRLGKGVYRFGIGGLHSTEKSVGYVATDDLWIIDDDVESYYPAIILILGLFPGHLGEAFLKVFRDLVNRRLHAKHKAKACKKAGDHAAAEFWKEQSDSLKITINGTFGKLGNLYSILYAPDLLTQVTITGQLCLLMLIEDIELVGIEVISANTDGVVKLCPPSRYDDLRTVIIGWEEATGFVTEETRYSKLYSRDVNSYIAIKEKGDPEAKFFDEIIGCKTKGAYCERGSAQNSVLSKNPEHLICSDAVQAFLAKGIPVHETIYESQDIRRFVSVRQVKGGAKKGGSYLGKAIRWYYAQGETGAIEYVMSGNAVPKSEGARPLMILPKDIPADLDRDWYVNTANKMLFELGYYQKPKVGQLF
jgi:hypothetical protein